MLRAVSLRSAAVSSVFLACLLAPLAARAHDETVSTSFVQVSEREVRWQVDVGVAGLAKIVTLPAPEGRLRPADLEAVRAPIAAALARGLGVRADGVDLRAEPTTLEPLLEPDPATGAQTLARVAQTFVFEAPAPITSLTLRLALFSDLTKSHRAVVRVLWNGHVRTLVRLGPSEISLAPEEMTPTAAALAREFLPWGVEHIFLGYDHIAFLLALLLGVTRLRDVVLVVTSFTVAHSLTLMLAAADVVRVPARISEALIAASIVAVALENLANRPSAARHRWLVTFAFGLIHGLGFATELRVRLAEIGGRLLVPVLSFNLGVELGQLAIVAVVLPLLTRLRRPDAPGAEARQRRLSRMASVPISLLGLYWLADRLFG
jgi:hydrogenase/urease accessory protein HupE